MSLFGEGVFGGVVGAASTGDRKGGVPPNDDVLGGVGILGEGTLGLLICDDDLAAACMPFSACSRRVSGSAEVEEKSSLRATIKASEPLASRSPKEA